ncbi:outer membrane protein assembly factor BamD [Nitrospirillum viridazoti CBAmc]|uniref:Outer membrane protein assembly factor BamD n=1 Tax=Nitrospirillum viridazoti CBAmc TaxID=1441467 RepID=A0A248JRL8_9PROT|nr:outer membrane protein assembly factor BamD [Nitrospirillum amazonense]ASG21131.1 outer membrane protein assembly factor BamD [Nitrospirillum amazonense CBAmc]
MPLSFPRIALSPRRLRRLVPLAAPLALFAVAACSSDEKEAPYIERPVEQIYSEAGNAIDRGEYQKAALLFGAVEQQHPYSTWAMRAELMAAYAYYQANKYEEAIGSLDRFISLHPGNPNVAYAYYLKGLCYYEQISDVRRDQTPTVQSLKALEEVIRRFPTSPYARDAKLKIDLTRDHLAGKEMDIGRYYQSVGLNLAAMKRFRQVVDQYQSTSHVPEALHRLVEVYLSLGMLDEARKAAAVLGYNYPGSDWYQNTYDLVKDLPKPRVIPVNLTAQPADTPTATPAAGPRAGAPVAAPEGQTAPAGDKPADLKAPDQKTTDQKADDKGEKPRQESKDRGFLGWLFGD